MMSRAASGLTMAFIFPSVDVTNVNSKLNHAVKTVFKMLWVLLIQVTKHFSFIFVANS